MLRRLKIDDGYHMLEWMHQPNVSIYFQEDFEHYDIDKVELFIRQSISKTNKHFAIVDINDEYLGTISLKNIDYVNLNAEYAIVLRECAMHTGCSREATLELLEYGFNELGLNKIYLKVLANNTRAINFYKKMNFVQEGLFRKHIKKKDTFVDLYWYSILCEEYR